jgi:hypothetical protein
MSRLLLGREAIAGGVVQPQVNFADATPYASC